MGGLGFAMFNALFYLALNHTTAINVVIIQSAMPVVIFLGNFVLFRTGILAAQIVGVVLTIIGVAYMVSTGDVQRLLSLSVNPGDALMLLAVLAYGGYTIALRWRPTLHWTSFLFALSLGALAASVPLAAWEVLAGRAAMPDSTGWMVVAYAAIFPAILAQIFFIAGIQTIGANRAGLFVNLVPIFGALLSVLLLGEAFRSYHLVALALVLAGITVAERSASARAANEAPTAL